MSDLVDHSILQSMLVLLDKHIFHMMKCKVRQVSA